jgi:hypothetical protein
VYPTLVGDLPIADDGIADIDAFWADQGNRRWKVREIDPVQFTPTVVMPPIWISPNESQTLGPIVQQYVVAGWTVRTA